MRIELDVTFDDWCDAKRINGSFREALFHHIMATLPETALEAKQENQALWEQVWNEVLSRIVERQNLDGFNNAN